MKRPHITKVTTIVPLRVPAPARHLYSVVLPADSDLLVACPDGFELCVSRGPETVRVFTRPVSPGSRRHRRAVPRAPDTVNSLPEVLEEDGSPDVG